MSSAVVCAAVLVVSGGPAAADCMGPTIEIEQSEVARGDELAISGSGWGDNCYDTGAPPAGEGVLGVPINNIRIFLVQGATEWLVATGSADADYQFDVAVVVPPDLQPGVAEVQARHGDVVAYSSDPQFVVVAAPAPTVADTEVVSFGPASASAADPSSPTLASDPGAPSERIAATTSTSTSTATAVLIVGGAAALAAAATVMFARARRG